MKTIVIYYSFSGHSKALAEKYANELSLDIAQMKNRKLFGKLKAYTAGCFAAIRGKAWPIAIDINLSAYEHIILFAPVWASNVPPAVNSFIANLPQGKTVSVKLVSASGHSGCKDAVEAKIKSSTCIMDSFEDIKG